MSAEQLTKPNTGVSSVKTGRLVVQKQIEQKPETLVTGSLLYEEDVVSLCLPEWGSSLDALADFEDAKAKVNGRNLNGSLVAINGIRKAKSL